MSDYIPHDLLTKFFLNLPFECLINCTSKIFLNLPFRVCKDWFVVISNPTFITKHTSKTLLKPSTKSLIRHYSITHSKEIYRVYDDETFDIEKSTRISFPFHEWSDYYFRIVGYCNGVMCLSDDLFRYKAIIILWNPSINRAFMLPFPRVVFDSSVYYKEYMFALGFGFDSVSNDYKVVRVVYSLEDQVHPPKFEVFSLSTGVWRIVENSVGCYINELSTPVFFEGAIHWCAYKKSSNNLVLRFNLGTEKFDELGLPVDDTFDPICMYATTIRGQFSVFIQDKGFIFVYVMHEYGNVGSWTRMSILWGDQSGPLNFFGFNRDDDTFYSSNFGELISCIIDDDTVTCTGIFGAKNSFFVTNYVESLALLDKGRVCRGKDPELDYEDEDKTVHKAEKRSKKRSLQLSASRIMHF